MAFLGFVGTHDGNDSVLDIPKMRALVGIMMPAFCHQVPTRLSENVESVTKIEVRICSRTVWSLKLESMLCVFEEGLSPRSPFWSAPLSHAGPEGVFVGTVRELRREVSLPRAEVPEEDSERVGVDPVVVFLTEQLRCHMDWRANHGAGYHSIRLTKTKISDFRSVVVVQQYILQLDISMDETL